MSRLRLPDAAGRWALAGAAVTALGSAAGRAGTDAAAAVAVAVVLIAGLAVFRRWWGVLVLAALLGGGALSGWLAAGREATILEGEAPHGPVKLIGRPLDDDRSSADGVWFLLRPSHIRTGAAWVEWPGPPLLISAPAGVQAAAAELVEVVGTATAVSGRARGDPYAGRVRARRVEVIAGPGDPLFAIGNALRRRITTHLADHRADGPAGLVAGFLIGDVRRLSPVELDAMRRAGLSHFVAVSGSNVALLLAAVWLSGGPLVAGPRRRALAAAGVLAVFLVVTRWEPSVLRAASMAILVLAGRAAGMPLSPWTALGAAVTGLLLVSGELVADVGFQLSVFATAGVLIGGDLLRGAGPRWLIAPASVTLAAQLAVAPLLLVHFGSVPLLAPVTNLVAGPLVAAATALGGMGVLTGVRPAATAAVALASLVLELAHWAASWPQLGPTGVLLAVCGGTLFTIRRTRPLATVGLAVWMIIVSLPATPPPVPTVVFLDVGQGDAALLLGPAGEAVLIDGGPDPARTLSALRRYGVGRLQLVVVSHPHQDHVAGLLPVVDRLPVDRLWHPGFPDPGPVFEEVLAAAGGKGVPVEVVGPGRYASIGSFHLEVIGPLRRYASPNDQSVVLYAEAGGLRVLFPGDVETIAQADLGPLPSDVLKVPHQGAATSDPKWLAASPARLSVISVGPNSFGHPAPEIEAVLARSGSAVVRTDEAGDVIVPLDPDSLATLVTSLGQS